MGHAGPERFLNFSQNIILPPIQGGGKYKSFIDNILLF